MEFRMLSALCLSLFLFPGTGVLAQATKEEIKKAAQEQLKAAVEARQYTFVARSANSMDGTLYQMTSTYSLKIYRDSLDIDLPYYGRVFAPTLGDTNKGIRFSSTSFSYIIKDEKKGGWFVTIIPKNNRNASKLELSMGRDGYSTLQVTSSYREQISFYGDVRAN